MAKNLSLNKASIAKEDEFYTQLNYIEDEMRHYWKQVEGKAILCNCDDPYESHFFKYFAMKFSFLGLRKLIATCYAGSPIQGQQLSLFDVKGLTQQIHGKPPYKIEITEVTDENADGAVDLADVECLLKNKRNVLTLLKGDGDFRSPECIKLLKQADIVVTNPPFSLLREYVAQLMEFGKKFVILGNQNAVTYKEIFRLLKDNKMWLGYYSGDMAFSVPTYYEERSTRFWIDENGQKWRSMGNICWFTNLDTIKRHESLKLYKKYTPEEYPHYDNYDAIEVSKIALIPYDWDGVMSVPITFLDKYNPEQFEILGIMDRQNTSGLRTRKYTSEDTPKYNDLNARGVLRINGELKAMYARILIKRIEAIE